MMSFTNWGWGGCGMHRHRLLGALLLLGLAVACSRVASAPDGRMGASAPPAGHPPVGPAKAAASISGMVSLSPRLAGRAKPDAALFLIARSGPAGQIVAVRREDGVRFQHAFEISGTDAMTEGTSFSGALEVTARLSRTGDAMPAKGDIEGVLKDVTPGTRNVELLLDTVRR